MQKIDGEQDVSYRSHDLNPPLINGIKILKKVFENIGVHIPERDEFEKYLTPENVQELVRMLVMSHLHLQAGPRKDDTVSFINGASDGVYNKIYGNLDTIFEGEEKNEGKLEFDEKNYFEKEIFKWLGVYRAMLMGISGLHPIRQDEIQESVPKDIIKRIVDLAVLKIKGKSGLGNVPEDSKTQNTIGEVIRKVTYLQTIPDTSGFHRLSDVKKQIIISSENFGVGFDGNDLENLGYGNISEKFEERALEYLVSILKQEDMTRKNICLRLGKFLSNNHHIKTVTQEDLEREYGEDYNPKIDNQKL